MFKLLHYSSHSSYGKSSSATHLEDKLKGAAVISSIALLPFVPDYYSKTVIKVLVV